MTNFTNLFYLLGKRHAVRTIIVLTIVSVGLLSITVRQAVHIHNERHVVVAPRQVGQNNTATVANNSLNANPASSSPTVPQTAPAQQSAPSTPAVDCGAVDRSLQPAVAKSAASDYALYLSGKAQYLSIDPSNPGAVQGSIDSSYLQYKSMLSAVYSDYVYYLEKSGCPPTLPELMPQPE